MRGDHRWWHTAFRPIEVQKGETARLLCGRCYKLLAETPTGTPCAVCGSFFCDPMEHH